MSAHTKGPFVAQRHIVRAGHNGRIVADCGPHHTPLSEYPAHCYEEDQANAVLLAASWDMLGALETVEDMMTEYWGSPEEYLENGDNRSDSFMRGHAAWLAWRSAIAKAKGGQQ